MSRVLNNHPKVSDALRQRVIAATNEAGYNPTVGRRSTRNIALVYTGDPSIGSPFDAALMAGLSLGLEEFGYDLMVLNARRARLPHETYTQMFVRKGVRGAVLRTTAQTRGVCEAIADEGFPSIVVADRFEQPNLSYVYSDSRESSREAVEHLLGLGHKRIAICINIIDDSDHADRLAGYKQAFADHGMEVDRRLVLRIPANRGGGAQLMRRVMTMPERPTAVFLTDPVTVVGALGEARRLGIEVPRELSIVGFDDAELRYSVHPELTAVCQDAASLAREAFKALHGMLEQADSAETEKDRSEKVSTDPTKALAVPLVVKKALRTWLEVHGSTAPPSVAPPAA